MPDTVLHEIGHVCSCLLTDTDITESRFWQWQNYLDWEQDEQLQGRASHLRAEQPWEGVLIAAFPLMLCFSCGALLYILAARLPFWYSLTAFVCGSIFIFHMSLSDSDVANIEQLCCCDKGGVRKVHGHIVVLLRKLDYPANSR